MHSGDKATPVAVFDGWRYAIRLLTSCLCFCTLVEDAKKLNQEVFDEAL